MTRTCPPEDVLADLLADRLPPEIESTIENHLAGCDRCRNRLDELTGWDDPPPSVRIPDEDTALPHRLVATVAARLARAIPVDPIARPRSAQLPTVLGYEIVAEIGRGGCGVVYRAVDRGLARTVALKLLRDRAGPEAHARFQREAEALARLRHPNVVQIYGVGQDDGQPFLALEYVAGGSLARFTTGQPQDPLAAATLVEALARGVGAAHRAGLVHRDLKPANVLLEPCPHRAGRPSLTDFVPKVTDFGVVKSLAAESDLTETRDFLGTPSYMAPEQAGAGRTVDHRADVYALGAILYELLTGHPPFRAATPIDTLVQVAFDEPVPPSRVQPRLPRDVETVCLKCLEKNPANRYQSAEALAEDLARFRVGRPVGARPIRWPARARRWCRRNPARAAVAALAASIMLILAVGGPILAQREHDLRQQADAHKATALAEKEHARQNLDLASRALDETLSGLVVNARLRAHGMDDVRAEMLRGAVPYLEDFAKREDGSADIRVRQGRAAIQLANVDVRDRRLDRAAEQFRRGIALFDSLTAGPDGERYVGDLANAHVEYGRFLLTCGDDASAAERHFREALRIADGIASDDDGTTAERDQKAIILSLLGIVPTDVPAASEERRALLDRALRIRERLAAENPSRADLRRYADMTAFNLGLRLAELGQKDEAAATLERALTEEIRLTGRAAVSADGPRLRAELEGHLGMVLFDLGRQADGIAHLRDAVHTARSAAELFPVELAFTLNALLWHDTLANMLEAGKDASQATEVRRAAVDFARRIVAAAPQIEAHRDGLLAARLTLAEQFQRRGLAEAGTEFDAAAAVGRQLPGMPTDRERAANRAECFRRLARRDLANDRPGEALVWLDGAVALIDRDPNWSVGEFRQSIEMSRASALDRLGRPAEAAAARDKAKACQRPLPPRGSAQPALPGSAMTVER